jgi:hypothetical protein
MQMSKFAPRMNENHTKRIVVSIAAALALLAGGTRAHSTTLVAGYTDATGNGHQAFGGNLALLFTANTGMVIKDMGIFDNLGVATIPTGTNVTVGIFTVPSVGTGSLVAGTEVTFSSGDSYTLSANDGDLFQSISPVKLAPGNYEVVAVGFNGNYKNGNTTAGSVPPALTGSVSMTYDGSAWNGATSLKFTNTSETDPPLAQFNAGTFEFTPAPEPGTLLLMGTGVLGLAGMVRRKFRKSVS